MPDHRVTSTPCRTCGNAANALAGPQEAPEPGDTIICIRCGEISELDRHMVPREFDLSQIDEQERAHILSMQLMTRLLRTAELVMRHRPHRRTAEAQ